MWAFAVLHILYAAVIWWFVFLPLVGEVTHSGAFDPTVIKWLLLAGAALATVLMAIAFFAGLVFEPNAARQNSIFWHFVTAMFLYVVITVWAFLWDDRKSDLFAGSGGSPIWPIFPQPCNAACRTAVAAQQMSYIEWIAILTLATLFITIILVSIIDGWRMLLVHRSKRGSGTGGGTGTYRKVSEKRGAGSKSGKRDNTELADDLFNN